MAFAITNKSQINPTASGQAGVLHYELADQVAAGTETDIADAGCKFIRVRLMVKSGMTNGHTFKFCVAVDNDDTMATPERIAFSPLMSFVTNDTYLTCEVFGWSETGFTTFRIIGTNGSGTAVYDALVDVW